MKGEGLTVFDRLKEELDSIMDVRQFVGRSAEQTEEFVRGVVEPILAANPVTDGKAAAINV